MTKACATVIICNVKFFTMARRRPTMKRSGKVRVKLVQHMFEHVSAHHEHDAFDILASFVVQVSSTSFFEILASGGYVRVS